MVSSWRRRSSGLEEGLAVEVVWVELVVVVVVWVELVVVVLWVSARLWTDPLMDAWWVLVVGKYVWGYVRAHPTSCS